MRRDARDLALEDLAEQQLAIETALCVALAESRVYRELTCEALTLAASYRVQVARQQEQLRELRDEFRRLTSRLVRSTDAA